MTHCHAKQVTLVQKGCVSLGEGREFSRIMLNWSVLISIKPLSSSKSDPVTQAIEIEIWCLCELKTAPFFRWQTGKMMLHVNCSGNSFSKAYCIKQIFMFIVRTLKVPLELIFFLAGSDNRTAISLMHLLRKSRTSDLEETEKSSPGSSLCFLYLYWRFEHWKIGFLNLNKLTASWLFISRECFISSGDFLATSLHKIPLSTPYQITKAKF